MQVVRWVYLKLRGKPLPVDVPQSYLIEFSFRKLIEALRGCAHGISYAGKVCLHFRGRGVEVIFPRGLTVGKGVAFANGVRVEAFCRDGVKLGDNVTIGARTLLSGTGVIAEPGEFVRIGNRSAIGSNNIIWGQGGVTIGDDCLLGPNVVVISENHDSSSTHIPIRQQGSIRAPIEIGNDCWIGAGAVILAGVTLGKGVIVGAGAVVTRDVPPLAVVAGVPARVISYREAREEDVSR
jgi:acetyltransferase-like isoleucine patch superfamily enzyme